MTKFNFTIDSLGECNYESPLKLSTVKGDLVADFVDDKARLIYQNEIMSDQITTGLKDDAVLELAGPREKLYFDPETTKAGIVTCGGLCPGLNDVIRAVVLTLWDNYGVRYIFGLPFGYKGLIAEYGIEPVVLNPEVVKDIHTKGGTMLGSSRGNGNRTSEMVDTIERLGLNILFTIGGDGTQKGALAISKEVRSRGLNCVVVGIPKTIDNDLSFVERTFGFATAVSKACESISSAHTEACGAQGGIGLVKVMGRESGFIAACTALAMNDVDFVLIPEISFDLEGPNGLLAALKTRLQNNGHAVVLAAEGAGQDMAASEGTDASGNKKLGDIGLILKARISEYMKAEGIDHTVKYIDPSYIIRSTPAIPVDSIYCARLGANAVHAGMSGKTGLLISMMQNRYVHVPIELCVQKRNIVDLDGPLWRDVVLATGQPYILKSKE